MVESSVALRADADGKIPDFGIGVVRARDGRLYTSTRHGQVAVWNSSGGFVEMIGMAGPGPGEFASGALQLHLDPRGFLYARDNNHRWSVFSASHQFVRSYSAVGMGYDARRSVFVDDGTFLTADLGSAQRAEFFFRVFDFAKEGELPATPNPRSGSGGYLPTLVRSFVPIPDAERRIPGAYLSRLVSYSGGRTFWAGPPMNGGRGYELQQFSTDGVLRRTIRREVPWFPRGADIRPPQQEGGPEQRPPGSITVLHDDGTGVLFVSVAVPSSRWRAGTRNADDRYDFYVEAIDGDAGVVLASSGPLRSSEVSQKYVHSFFPRSRQGYRRVEMADGLPAIRLVEARLIAK
jgi:hypothetical protein